jgi:hypothetical protein
VAGLEPATTCTQSTCNCHYATPRSTRHNAINQEKIGVRTSRINFAVQVCEKRAKDFSITAAYVSERRVVKHHWIDFPDCVALAATKSEEAMRDVMLNKLDLLHFRRVATVSVQDELTDKRFDVLETHAITYIMFICMIASSGTSWIRTRQPFGPVYQTGGFNQAPSCPISIVSL